MNRILFFAAVYFSLPAATAQAAVFERDWKTPGDGLLTYDDVNQREWLDLSETLLFQFSGDISDRLAEVIDETAPGGLFAGFSAATAADVMSLSESAGIDTSTNSYAINQAASNHLIDLLGATSTFSLTDRRTRGFLSDFPNGVRIVATASTEFAGIFDGTISTDPSGLLFETGVWLYREAVPEPTTSILLMTGIMFLLCRRHFS